VNETPHATSETLPLCVVIPCRDEAAYARRTIDSILSQSALPRMVVFVDDGSTDDTPRILAERCAAHAFMTTVTLADRGARRVGPGVVHAFNAGLEHARRLPEFDGVEFICKLDLDLDLPPRYFELLIARMRDEPRLGTISGKAYYPPQAMRGEPIPTRDALLRGDRFDTSRLIAEGGGDEMSQGMTKLYRLACFDAIGGFVAEVMWDGIDCHRCRMLGWRARSEDTPELRFVHLRPMGSSDRGVLTGRMRHGYGQYYMGTSLPYMIASAAYGATRRPYLVGGAAMLWGYLRSMLRGERRYGDPAFRRFLRAYQRRALLVGKRRAIDEIERRRA